MPQNLQVNYASLYAVKQIAVLDLLDQLRSAVANMTPADSKLLTIDDLEELMHIETDLAETLTYFTPIKNEIRQPA